MPIVKIADVPNVLVVHPSLGVRNFEGFVAYAKANPGRLNYGSTGIGTSSHLSGYMLCKRVGIDATHIPYKGADALNDLLVGRVQFMFATIPSVIQHIQAGKLLPVAMSSAKRSRSLPEVPTVIENGLAGFEAGSWFGFFAPKGTPEPIIAQLNRAVNDVLAMPEEDRVLESLELAPDFPQHREAVVEGVVDDLVEEVAGPTREQLLAELLGAPAGRYHVRRNRHDRFSRPDRIRAFSGDRAQGDPVEGGLIEEAV